jgi:hypothetical protein
MPASSRCDRAWVASSEATLSFHSFFTLSGSIPCLDHFLDRVFSLSGFIPYLGLYPVWAQSLPGFFPIWPEITFGIEICLSLSMAPSIAAILKTSFSRGLQTTPERSASNGLFSLDLSFFSRFQLLLRVPERPTRRWQHPGVFSCIG